MASPNPPPPAASANFLRSAILWSLLASLAAWAFASWHMVSRGLLFTVTDDFPRLVLAIAWSQHPFLVPPSGTFWLPLIYYVHGVCYLMVHPWAGFYWHDVVSSFFSGIACWLVMLAALQALNAESRPLLRGQKLIAAGTALALALSMPVAWRLSASGMSEPIFMTWQGMLVLGVVALYCPARRGNSEQDPPPLAPDHEASPPAAPSPSHRAAWTLILLGGLFSEMSRYEGWLLSFAVWTIIHALPPSSPSPQARFARTWWKRLILGYAFFAAWPLFWIWINYHYDHDPLHFLKWAQLMSESRPEVTSATTWGRIVYLSNFAVQQGWVILLGLPLAFWQMRRRRQLWPLLLTFLAATAVYYQSAVSNTIGSALPWRFCLGPLWVGIVVVAYALATLSQRRLRMIAAGAFLFAVFENALYWDNQNWGGSNIAEPELQQLDKMQKLAQQGYVMVLDSTAITGMENLLRIYCGLDHVTVADDAAVYPHGRVTPGKYVYFFVTHHYYNPPGAQGAFGACYFLLDQMPPPPGIAAEIATAKRDDTPEPRIDIPQQPR